MTETSLLPDIARGVGLSFDDLVEAIVREALERKA
jgi:D-alanine-D-alanine ligase-like ATP-grasp enzyme